MLFYIGTLVLVIAALQLSIFIWQQLLSIHNDQRSYQLETQLLEEKVAEKAARNKKVSELSSNWSGWRKFRIKKIVKENSTINSFYLTPHDGKPLSEFFPGQHLTFKLKIPGTSKPVIRCYTLSDNAQQTDYYRVTIRKQTAPTDDTTAPDGVASCYFHDHLQQGDILDVKAPAGKFFLDMTDRSPVVLIAGGVGLTPSLSMLNTLWANKSQREIWLFYGVRTTGDQIMPEHFRLARKELANFHLFKLFSKAAEDDLKDIDACKGHVTAEFIQKAGAPMDADFYICGPPGMMSSMQEGLQLLGVDEERIHYESFGPASIEPRTAKTVTASKAGNKSFQVHFGISGKSLEWNNSSGSLLDAAEAAGIQMDSGCRAGSCGTCLTAILEGDVDYIDEPGTTVENGSCLPCVAVPKTNLKLNA